MDPHRLKDGDYPPHQLVPVEGGRYTTPIHGPPGTEIGTLPTDITEDEGLVTVHSGWMPSDEQIRQLKSGAHVRLSVWAWPMVPVAVCVEPPVCEHGEEMVWSESYEGYHCNHTGGITI